MTISEFELYQTPTTSLARPHKFYPAPITIPHHQLRHHISTSQQDRIYYVNNYDIFTIDLRSQQSTLLATIPFEARCLAADHGYVCVGGEANGDSAFIKLELDNGVPKCFGHDLNVVVLGGEIVNSMNIHILSPDGSGEDEPVVLISNNDKTVKIYSLVQRRILTTLRFPVPMNYAAMSPDSKIIAAVGDCHNVFFYQRQNSSHSMDGLTRYPEYQWEPMAIPIIPTGEEVYDDYGFAVAFSPSGGLCAASSQGGCITVFDMDSVSDKRTFRNDGSTPQESIICSFRSSRPTLWGCVRAMAFSPGPWDLLAWAEDHGRVGVADVKSLFLRRQVLQLDKQASETVDVADGTPTAYRSLGVKERLKQQHLARLRSMRGLLPEATRTDQLLAETRAGISQHRRQRPDLLSYHHGLELDARERSIFEALETTMDDVQHTSATPYSVTYRSSPPIRPSASDTRREYEVQLLNPESRSDSRSHQPRRRTSVVLSESSLSRHLAPDESSRVRLSASPGRMTDDEGLPPMSTNDLTPTSGGSSTQPLPYNIPTSDPWHVIQAALETARRADTDGHVSSGESRTILQEVEVALEAERHFSEQLERQLADEQQLSRHLQDRIERQERAIRAHQRELQREAVERTEPSLDRSLQRALESERQFGEQRSQDLETELRLGTNRTRRLEAERARLLNSSTSNTSMEPVDSTTTSARTTTLPTTNLRQVDSTDTLASTLQRHETSRRQRLAHIEDLERQVRRAESRVETATSDIQAWEDALQRGVNNERHARPGEARSQTRARVVAAAALAAANGTNEGPEQSGSVRQRAAVRRAELAMNADRAPEGVRSELSGRVPEAEMRLARMMFMSSMRGNRAVDANGNWVAGNGVRRPIGRGAATTDDSLAQESAGPGTAGIGWSPDGRFLYAGSEEGIFTFKVNMRDRMTFPTFEMR